MKMKIFLVLTAAVIITAPKCMSYISTEIPISVRLLRLSVLDEQEKEQARLKEDRKKIGQYLVDNFETLPIEEIRNILHQQPDLTLRKKVKDKYTYTALELSIIQGYFNLFKHIYQKTKKSLTDKDILGLIKFAKLFYSKSTITGLSKFHDIGIKREILSFIGNYPEYSQLSLFLKGNKKDKLNLVVQQLGVIKQKDDFQLIPFTTQDKTHFRSYYADLISRTNFARKIVEFLKNRYVDHIDFSKPSLPQNNIKQEK